MISEVSTCVKPILNCMLDVLGLVGGFVLGFLIVFWFGLVFLRYSI